LKKLIPLLLILITTITFASTQATKSVVKIHSSVSLPNYKQPWQSSNRIQISGSGVLIKDNYIITNAHVISDAKFVQVSKENDSKRYTASIEYVSHQADLALLKVKDETFYEDIAPLKLIEDVNTGDNITVLGYPLGGNNLSTTKGTVSRIEQHSYVWSYEYMLSIQVDAAINSGNSGGPAIDDKNNIVGIVMQSYSKKVSDNIGYIIPSIIVKTFLEDIKDGKVDGFDNSNTYIGKLINPSLKDYYNVTTNQGVLVTKIEKNEDALKLGDIILEVEGNKILNNGKVKTKYGLQAMKYFEHLKPVGQTIDLKIRRDNKIVDIKYTLKRKNLIINKEYFKNPRYLIFGGLVFAPFTENYLRARNSAPLLFENFYKLKEKAKHATEGVIVQVEKFDHSVNEGYYPFIYLIHSVNEVKVKDFKHFVKLIDESNGKYTVIDFIDLDYTKYVFDTKKAKESFQEIKNIYGLSTDRRVK
tara:strand:- start:12360 stop:13778 length:1419 start_codon:yes stop_codon:yes gene_type:complete